MSGIYIQTEVKTLEENMELNKSMDGMIYLPTLFIFIDKN